MRKTSGGLLKYALGLVLGCMLAFGLWPAIGFANEVEVEPEVETRGNWEGEPESNGRLDTQSVLSQQIGHDGHDGVDAWQVWIDPFALPTKAGNYCLYTNVLLTNTWKVPHGTTNLCLNGYGILGIGSLEFLSSSLPSQLPSWDDIISKWNAMTSNVVAVNTESKLNVYDCQTDAKEHHYNIDNSLGLATVPRLSSAGQNKSFTGGFIAGGGVSGVLVDGGEFNMHAGTIISNGWNSDSMSMLNGGVCVNSGTFNMYGGSIMGNRGRLGGGVCLMATTAIDGYENSTQSSSFTMTDGVIRENTALLGGGVSVLTGSFSMSGGVITENTANIGGGVCVAPGDGRGSISLSGAPQISGNNAASGKNLLLMQGGEAGDSLVTVDGAFTVQEPSVGVSIAKANYGSSGIDAIQQSDESENPLPLTGGTFTMGFAQNNPGMDPRSVFTSDSDDYHVFFTADEKEAQLAVPRKIECAQIQNGKVETKDEAAAGEVIKLAVTADIGYELDTLTVVGKTSGKAVAVSADNVFTMPDEDVTVSATFKPLPLEVPTANVTAHVQRTGWLPQTTAAGAIAGTTGQSRRLEALKLTLSGASVMTSEEKVSGGIEYRAHLQRKGWETDWVRDDAQCGTTGQSRRLEAVQIRLYGDMEKKFDVYYRVHVQRIGWMGWAKNGQEAGTQGMSRRAEAVQVALVEKDAAAPDATYNGVTQQYAKAFVKK